MFERFTDRARNVVVLAQQEARLLKHNYIGTEHILLGLARESDGLAAKALDALGVELEAVREQVVEITGQGQESPSGHIPFTPRAKKVLELSLREALQFGHNYIGTEHILLGLIREGEGVAAQVLVRLGGDLSAVRQQVIRLLKENPTTDELPRAAQAAQAQAAQAQAARLAESAGEAGIASRAEGAVPMGLASPAESASLNGKLTEVLSRLDSIGNRMTLIEQALGIGTAKDDD
jgi:ATP-dependent Clp protease ATP-binding subunit ClpC